MIMIMIYLNNVIIIIIINIILLNSITTLIMIMLFLTSFFPQWLRASKSAVKGQSRWEKKYTNTQMHKYTNTQGREIHIFEKI